MRRTTRAVTAAAFAAGIGLVAAAPAQAMEIYEISDATRIAEGAAVEGTYKVSCTAGSNIFLLTLCMGAVMLDTSGQFNGGNVAVPELLVLWLSTASFTLTMWIDGRFHRWVGATMLLGYVVFMVVEFTIVRHV